MADGGMAGDDPGRTNRRLIAISLGVTALVTGSWVAGATHSALAGVGAVLAMGGLLWWLIARGRAKADADLARAAAGVVGIDAALDFGTVPERWRAQALESMGALGVNNPSMPVRVQIVEGWLLVEKRRVLGGRKYAFALRVPVAALIASDVAKPRLGLVGSSITLRLSTGDELVLDIATGHGPAAALARQLSEAGAAAREHDLPGPLTLDLVGVAPPQRTPPALAGVMMMACLGPFVIAMMGAVDGPFAAVAASLLLFAGNGLMLGRPVWMGRALARGAWVTAAAFAIDTLVTRQVLRAAGVICGVALALWLRSLDKRTGVR